MTEKIQNPTNTISPETKQNPFDGMAEKLEHQITESTPNNMTEYRTLDPAYILGRQMLALDDIFDEALGKFHDRKTKPYNDAYSMMLPMVLKIQQNCLATARTITNIDYIEHLQNTYRSPHPLKIDKQKEGHE